MKRQLRDLFFFLTTLLVMTGLFVFKSYGLEAGRNTLATEALVSLSEQNAIDALNRIINKKQNSPEEADLQERLAELYLKQAKSVRYFALNTTNERNQRLLPPVIKDKATLRPLKNAVAAYQRIQKQFPKYENTDRVLFHKALTLAQMGLANESIQEIEILLAKYPQSEWKSDAHLLIGEVLYDQHQFQKALAHFQSAATSDKIKIAHYAKYKAGWTFYNLERNSDAIQELKSLVTSLDPEKPEGFALRSESLRDLALFMTETKGNDAAAFFRAFATETETASCLLRMANIYTNHSKYELAQKMAKDYIRQGQDESGKIQFHLMLAKQARTLKIARESKDLNQIEQLQGAFELCLIQPAQSEVCEKDLRNEMNEAAEEAWKKWDKSKKREDLLLAKSILEIEIERNPSPRAKTLEAYADLLFQSEDFENAARINRTLVSLNSKNEQEKTRFQYASLVALDRWMSQDKDQVLAKEYFKDEVAIYLKANPKSEHQSELRDRWARIQIGEKDYASAEKNLRQALNPGENKSTKADRKESLQDLLLETLDAQGKRRELRQELSQDLGDAKGNPARETELKRWMARLQLEDLEKQIDTPTSPEQNKKALSEYLQFLKTYESDATVSEPVFWKTLALAMTSEADTIVLDLIQPRLKDGKKVDPRIWDSLKALLQRGKLPLAPLFESALRVAPLAERGDIQWAYREYLREHKINSSRQADLENQILASKIEPARSLIQVERLEKEFELGHYSKVFQAARPLAATSQPVLVKARARLIQARVLDHEFREQRVKTSTQKLQIVIALKLERLAKVQEAYLAVMQIAAGTSYAKTAQAGLRSAFEHGIAALKSIEIKDDLSAQDRKVLDQQMQTLVAPLESQLKELIAMEEVKS